MSAAISGRGIHRGEHARVWLHRHSGPLAFRVRGEQIEATLAQVVDTRRCTVLGVAGAQVMMVEHLLAACHALGYWSGVLIELDGIELPILDGSAAPWCEPLAALGPPPDAPAPWVVAATSSWREGASEVRFEPGTAGLDVSIDFAHPAIGQQRYRGIAGEHERVLDARTFAFATEMAALQAHGFALGAEAGSGILFGDEDSLVPLRSSDEPVRHKALDALGDMVLLGQPLAGRVVIHRGSHQLHVAALRKLVSQTRGVA